MAEFLLEIGTEEIPARMLSKAVRDLRVAFAELFGEAQLAYEGLESCGTLRQLVVSCRDVQERQLDRDELVLGPPVRIAFDADGNPTKALAGFLRKNDDLSRDDLFEQEQPKGSVLAAKRHVPGQLTLELLAQSIPRILANMHFAKNMRWGALDTLFVRPVRTLLAMFDGRLVPCSFANVDAGLTSFGHRFHGHDFTAVSIDAFFEGKRDNHIMCSHRARVESIKQQIDHHLQDVQGVLVPDDDLLREVADLVECPYVVLGSFGSEFLDVPREVLITSLKEHQKSFCVQDMNGHLMPNFLSIASVPRDPKGLIRKGNEWVLKARLWDAKFFWDSDRKKDLEQLRTKLNDLMFQSQLGSFLEKSERIEALAEVTGRLLGWSDRELGDLATAARHAKTDLVSEMVFEFPELQGVIGGLLLREQARHRLVWKGVYEHYLPNGADDPLPQTETGLVISLVDKLDTLSCCFSIGLVPTGTKDPYALRRAAQGVIRILMESELPLALPDLIREAVARLEVSDEATLLDQLDRFFNDRIRYQLKRRGFDHDVIDAVMAQEPRRVDHVLKRAEAVVAQQSRDDFRSLALNLKRMKNVIADEIDDLVDFDDQRLVEPVEGELWRRFQALRPRIESACRGEDFNRAMDLMTELAQPVDLYFSPGGVYVNADDAAVRRNRKAMMRDMLVTLSLVGDVAYLEAK